VSTNWPKADEAIPQANSLPVVSGVQKVVLPSGLTIVTESMPAVRSVSIGIWLRAGSRHEREEENGISHFLEHMVFKGTKNRTAEEIARSADSIGGHLDAFTSKEYTGFSIKALDDHLGRAFEVLADLLKNPLFRPDHIAMERSVVQEEIKMLEDTPDDLVHEIFAQRYWRGHALGRPIIGTLRTVRSFDRQRLLDYFRRYYAPNNMLVTAAGHLEHNQVVDLVASEFGDAPAGAAAADGAPPVSRPGVAFRRKKNLEQVHICVGTTAYPQAHPKRYATYILNTVLGGGMSSHLFQNIREKRGLAYAVFSSLNAFRDAGYLSVYAGTAREKARQVVQLIVQEFRQLKSDPISEEELQRAKDYLKGSMLLALESTTSRMSNLARQELYFGRHISLDEIAKGIDAVTAEEVRSVARELFDADRIALTALGPSDGLSITRADLAC